MENFKIIQVLSSFNRKEVRLFGEFTASPYFNKNKSVQRLFNTFEKYYPDFNNRNFTLEKIYEKVFPDEKYDYHKLNNVMSDLYKLAEKFLAYRHIESTEFYIERNIFEELRAKGLYKIYEQKHSSYMKELLDRKHKDEDYFFNLYEMNDEYLWYTTIKKPNTELNILQAQFDHFFNFSLIRLLRLYNLMMHERNQNNVNYKLTMFNEVLEFIQNGQTEEIPLILVFKTIFLLLYTKDKKYYTELWLLKEKYADDFKINDRYLVYIHLYDFAAYMVNFKGDDSYNRDMFNIYKEQIDKKIMVPKDFLFFNYINVVKIACRVKEFDYAENFMKEFGPYLPENEKINVTEFCLGTIENARGNPEKALVHFSKSNFQNFILKVQVKILLLKIYYKLGMYEQTLGMIDTFRHYVAREEKMLAEHRESYNKFLILMGELIKIKESGSKDKSFELGKIKKEAEKIPANPFRVRTWLLDELN